MTNYHFLNLKVFISILFLFANMYSFSAFPDEIDNNTNEGFFNFTSLDENEDPDDTLRKELKMIKLETDLYVISPAKTPEQINKSAATITVITDEDIRNMGARNIMDVLRTVPGLGVTQSEIWIKEIESRGIKTLFSEKILFVLDGHSLDNNLVNGGPTQVFGTLALDNVKRIEVIIGPASALYGANAFLALVHIITKDTSDIEGFEVNVKRGSYQTEQYNILYGKEFGELGVVANFNIFNSDGFGARVDQDGLTDFNFSAAPDKTEQWGRKQELDLKLEYKGIEFQGKYLKRKDGDYFGPVPAITDESKFRNSDYFFEISYDHDFTNDLNVDVRLYRDFYHLHNNFELFPEGYIDPITGGEFPDGMLLDGEGKNNKTGGEVLGTYNLFKTNTIIVGAMAEHQKQYDIVHKLNYDPLTFAPLGEKQDLSEISPWAPSVTRDLWAVYVEDLWDIRKNLRLTLGARFDHYNDFGGELSPRVGVSWEFINGFNLKLMYGQAFRAPTFAELHNINNPVVIGNSSLDPEQVETIELGLNAHITDYLSGRFTIFRNDIRDLITIVNNTHENAGRARITGVEFAIKSDLWEDSYVGANYTYQHPKNRETGERIADVPSHKANIMANFAISKHFNLYSDVFIKDSTPRTSDDTRDEVPGYYIVNSTLRITNLLNKYKLFDGFELKASVYNVFDKKYVDPSPVNTFPDDFAMPERSFMFEMLFHY